jgi:phosphoribosylamine--glycine ligase
MNTLFIGFRTSTSALARHVAIKCPNDNVDLVGLPLINNIPENLNYLGNFNNKIDDCFEWLKKQKYDFIYCAEYDWQVMEEFQEWRKTSDSIILCPAIETSILEKNKLECKKILDKLEIPNSEYKILENDDSEDVMNWVEKYGKCVLKLSDAWTSSGLQTRIVADDSYKNLLKMFRDYGYSGKVYIEKFIKGKEASVQFLCNGNEALFLGAARDYKKLYEDDLGQNCSSAGCYSPIEYFDAEKIELVTSYANKLINYFKENDVPYIGMMYIGIIIDDNDKTFILEINVRPGNPEFNNVLQRIESNNLLKNMINATLQKDMEKIQFNDDHVLTINLLHKKYSPVIEYAEEPILNVPDNYLIEMFDTSIRKQIYCSITNKSKNREQLVEEMHNHLLEMKKGSYRYRYDVGYLI